MGGRLSVSESVHRYALALYWGLFVRASTSCSRPKMKSSGKNDVSIIVSITAAAALIYGVVIWRARVVAQRMEEDVSNIWIGDGTPMVK